MKVFPRLFPDPETVIVFVATLGVFAICVGIAVAVARNPSKSSSTCPRCGKEVCLVAP